MTKKIVKLRHGYGRVAIVVNGEKVDLPDVDDRRTFGNEREKVDLDEMVEAFAQDKCRSMICGDQSLDKRQIAELASRLRPYWEEIDDVLGIEE